MPRQAGIGAMSASENFSKILKSTPLSFSDCPASIGFPEKDSGLTRHPSIKDPHCGPRGRFAFMDASMKASFSIAMRDGSVLTASGRFPGSEEASALVTYDPELAPWIRKPVCTLVQLTSKMIQAGTALRGITSALLTPLEREGDRVVNTPSRPFDCPPPRLSLPPAKAIEVGTSARR